MDTPTTDSKSATRNFYEELFSPDTESLTPPISDHSENSEYLTSIEDCDNYTFSGISLVEKHINITETRKLNLSSTSSPFSIHRSKLKCDESSFSGSDMDISTDSESDSSLGTSLDESLSNCEQNSLSSSSIINDEEGISEEQQTSIQQEINECVEPVINFLEDEDVEYLFGENVQLPQPEQRETLEKHNVDTIASFNVRNKYDHNIAAELMIKEKLTFLSIQEPYASSHKASESWKAFQKLELESARISCFETPYQMILFDSWKWGGKVISPFQSLQYGRVASIGFNLGDKFQLGIISIYAPSKDGKSSHYSEEATHPTMQITNNIVQKILSKWKSQYPKMVTMILGDFQETVSSLDRDNLGEYRRDPTSNGVLMGLLNSHDSIVRTKNPNSPYVTRFGDEGARGIDHIFFPSDAESKHICTDAKIRRDVGASYFPSDHSLITCDISRSGQNNNCGGLDKTKYAYNKLFSIKLNQTGPLGEELEFDRTQFKDCRKYKDQLDLYKKIQQLTGNDSNLTNAHLGDLEIRADLLFQDLWTNGINQNTHGPTNKLVRISEANAAELSYILNKYNVAIKTIMTELKLDRDHNNNDSSGKTRGRLRTRSGFKIFNNLPVPTKLRYLKVQVDAKLKEINKNLYWLKEFHIRSKHGEEKDMPHQDQFWNQWNLILKDDILRRRATEVAIAYTEESDERMLHNSAREYERNKNGSRKNCKNHNDDEPSVGNTLRHVPDNVTRLLNFWLSSSGCNQGFSTASSPPKISEGSTAFLTERIKDWKEHLSSQEVDEFDLSTPHQAKIVQSCLEKAQNDIKKLNVQITKIQVFHRQSTLNHFLDTNNISSFTNKVCFKSRQAPAAHTSIWDPHLQDFRTCKDELEELHATSAFHGKWMANSASKEVCAFAKIVKDGRLGNRGIKLCPDRIVTMADIPHLIHNGKSLPREIQKSFLKAHGPHTANLFREPVTDNPHFFYPFYLLNEKGKISEGEEIEKKLWKAIATIPSKARFEGFQLAVVGRFASRWRNLLLKIIKLILIMRYIPPALRKMARFPIPKPGKHNEYRPISLCHDLYCYVMGIVTSYSSNAIEKAGILHSGLTAYQRGKGCANLVTTELSFREDCLESYAPSVQIDEDEEKFFDRIPVEILLAAMRVNGFPNQGYIEIKASAMEAKTVEIITAKGVTYARFICGLEQGNPDSPTVSNLVIKFKHDVWGHISKEIKKIFEENDCIHQESYSFNSKNEEDGQVYLCKIGYSDDNSKFISIKNENDLLELVKYFTQLSGDISMVTKIGRKSSKCEVQFYNISAELAMKMKKVWSTAWSFVDDSPVEEQIPFKIHMKLPELEKFYQLMNFFDLEEEEQYAWNQIIRAPAHRHLGLSSTLGADTSMAWRKTLEKMKEKLVKLNIYKMNSQAQKKCFNMLVGTIPTFVPVQINYPSKELIQFDKYAASFCLKSNGLSASDSKIRMFIPENVGGLGLNSTLELDLISVAREFEILANNVTLDSRTFRTRISAIDNYCLQSLFVSKNHARDAIAKLARYGIYLRHAKDEVINEILAEIARTSKKFLPFSHKNYKDNCTIGVGLGKERNKELMYGGPTHSILKALEKNNWKTSEKIGLAAKPFRISIKNLLSIRKNVLGKGNEATALFFNHWEWKNHYFSHIKRIPDDIDKWKSCNFSTLNDGYGSMTNSEFLANCTRESKIMWNNHARMQGNNSTLAFNSYTWEGRFLDFLMNSKSPIIIATDGSHAETEKHRKTSSSFVLCVLDIHKGESLASGNWEHRPVIPILSRTSALPQNFGTCNSDIAHGESCAILMAEMALTDIPRITITDSKAIRESMIKLRKLDSGINDRTYIRSVAGGLGKFVCGSIKNSIFHAKSNGQTFIQSNAMNEISKILENRNKEFLRIAKTWTTRTARNQDSDLVGWEEKYFDNCITKPILKVDSHQLEETGTKIKNPPRYRKLIPNLSVLNANFHADCCAEYGRKFQDVPYEFNQPNSHLRFFFTCEGRNIDRNISDFCHEQFVLLKIRKLRLKETQGLLWRIRPHTTTSWDYLNLHKGWMRALLGLSSTHTRRVYKSQIYRECSRAKYISTIQDNPNVCEEIKNASVQKAITFLSGCLWCNKKLQNSHKGNRNHAMLICNNNNISEFRKKATNLIESKFKLFFLELARATSKNNVTKCIKKVETTFLDLQIQNLGRLHPIQRELNSRYISCEAILNREGLTSIQEAVESRKFNFLCEVFGLLPNLNGMEVRDDQLGVSDCPWLGLTSLRIDKDVSDICDSIFDFIPHKDTATALRENLKDSWQEIKTLIMGKAIGIHRIICSTGRKIEKDWRKEYNIDISSFRKLKRESNPETFTTGKRKPDSTAEPGKERKKKQRVISSQLDGVNFKSCNGITCHMKYKSWCPSNKFTQNRIKSTIKQCQRCGRHMTAIKQCLEIIQNMIDSQKSSSIATLYTYISNNHKSMQYNYKQLVSLMNGCLDSSFHLNNFTKSSQRIPDRIKLIGNILCIALRKASLNFLSHNQGMLQKATSILNGIQNCKESDFKLNRKAETKIKLLTSNNITKPCKLPTKTKKTIILKKASNFNDTKEIRKKEQSHPAPAIFKSDHRAPSTCNEDGTKFHTTKKATQHQLKVIDIPIICPRKKPKLAIFAANIIRPSICLSGDGMTKAIEVLRSYKVPHLYIASAEASNQISSWSFNQSWNQFAKMFGSRNLHDTKPNGTYLIPMYAGGTGMGHWYLFVIFKIRQRFIKAWCIDSMGKGTVNRNFAQKVEKAFAPGRATLRWEPYECRSQEELECGPRTVLAMKIIKEGLEKNIPVEESIMKTTLWHHPYQTHTPAMVREDAAHFINEYSPSMITPPLRYRRRSIHTTNRTRTLKPNIKCIEIDLSQD